MGFGRKTAFVACRLRRRFVIPTTAALMAVVGDPRGSLAATSDQSLLHQRLKTQASAIDGIGVLPALQRSDA